MGKNQLERDLRDAGVRKKRARKVATAADRGRAGDRAARELVERHSTALRDSISALVRHASPPKSKSATKATTKKAATTRKAATTKKAATKKAATKKAATKRTAKKRTATKRAGAGSAT